MLGSVPVITTVVIAVAAVLTKLSLHQYCQRLGIVQVVPDGDASRHDHELSVPKMALRLIGKQATVERS